jgi:hypothetical protein
VAACGKRNNRGFRFAAGAVQSSLGFELKEEWLSLIRAYPERFLIGSDNFYMTP